MHRAWGGEACALLVAAGLLAGCGGGHSRYARGYEVYVEHCASCHQIDGRGYDQIYPNLAGNPIVQSRDPDAVISTVLKGRGGMPGFGGELSSDQLADVISYIRAAWANDAPPVHSTEVR